MNFPDGSFDGVYNLGVMEHFTEQEVLQILAEFRRVLVPGGKIVIFWPHIHAPSVYVLGLAHWFFRSVLRRSVQFHPAEVTLLRSRQQAWDLLTRSHLTLEEFHLGPRDLFIQAVIVARKTCDNN
jgi:ubiquinone/menaquinone biosynthesis C-methylase UbiE